MTADRGDDEIPADRESPVGEPVIRGDEAIAGQRAEEAVEFDPADPESLQRAAETVRAFATETVGSEDNIYMLRGSAACAALVRGEGSYKAAAERAGEDVTVAFIRKWARVHDLPRAVRRHVATGEIAPTAAKHIARVSGPARYDLAWATLDHDLTVRDVRSIASEIGKGADPAVALREHGVDPGTVRVALPMDTYRTLRREAATSGQTPGDIVAEALAEDEAF